MSCRLVIKFDPKGRSMMLDRHPGAVYLGIVYRGMEFGALASTPDGRYLKINGDVVEALHTPRVHEAMARAERTRRNTSAAPHTKSRRAPVPAVLPAPPAPLAPAPQPQPAACESAASGIPVQPDPRPREGVEKVHAADDMETLVTAQGPVIRFKPRRRIPAPEPARPGGEPEVTSDAMPEATLSPAARP